MAVLSALTKLPSVAPAEEEVAAAALAVVEATTLEAEEDTVVKEVDIVCVGHTHLWTSANMARRRWRWRRLWWT